MNKTKGLIILIVVVFIALVGVLFFDREDTNTVITNDSVLDNVSDYSQDSFVSTDPSIQITSPKSGTVFKVGDTVVVNWKIKNMPDERNVRYQVDMWGNGESGSRCGMGGSDYKGDFTSLIEIPEKICVGKYSNGVNTEHGNPYTIKVQAFRTSPSDTSLIVESAPIEIKVTK